MYNVSKSLTSAYGAELEPKQVKSSGAVMPQVTGGDRRMTNVKLASGDIVQGIRRNDKESNGSSLRGNKENQLLADDGGEGARNFKPLRYTPGLKCDAHLESLRPERSNKHSAFTGPEQYGYRKKLIQNPDQAFEGSFADADLEKFRPEPKQQSTADPWFTSRVPDHEFFPLNERLAGHAQGYQATAASPYEQIYPQDELSRIKMRNRRFQNSLGGAAPEDPSAMMGYPAMPQHPMMISPQAYYGGYPPMGYPMGYPSMMGPPMMPQQQQMMMPPQQQQQLPQEVSPLDDLKVLDQELNVTRRVTRPFVPTESPDYAGLKKQREIMEEPLMPIPVQKPKTAVELCPTSVDQLPKPRRGPPRKKAAEGEEDDGLPPRRGAKQQEVRIADNIAIRSMVLGKNLPNIGSGAGSGVASPVGKGVRSASLPSSGGGGGGPLSQSSAVGSPEQAPASPIQQQVQE